MRAFLNKANDTISKITRNTEKLRKDISKFYHAYVAPVADPDSFLYKPATKEAEEDVHVPDIDHATSSSAFNTRYGTKLTY